MEKVRRQKEVGDEAESSVSTIVRTIGAERFGLHLKEELLGVMGAFVQHAQICVLIKSF